MQCSEGSTVERAGNPFIRTQYDHKSLNSHPNFLLTYIVLLYKNFSCRIWRRMGGVKSNQRENNHVTYLARFRQQEEILEKLLALNLERSKANRE